MEQKLERELERVYDDAALLDLVWVRVLQEINPLYLDTWVTDIGNYVYEYLNKDIKYVIGHYEFDLIQAYLKFPGTLYEFADWLWKGGDSFEAPDLEEPLIMGRKWSGYDSSLTALKEKVEEINEELKQERAAMQLE